MKRQQRQDEPDPLTLGLDLRLATGLPFFGENPIKMLCPMHNDVQGSLLVDVDHCYCLGCPGGRYLRRFEGLALLLGLWDGNPATAKEAALKAKERRGEFQAGQPTKQAGRKPAKPLDGSLPHLFHRYLMSHPTRLKEFQDWRGFDEMEIRKYEFGWTGSHFSIPIRGMAGDLRAIRYRAPRDAATTEDGGKYEGTAGSNETQLFSLPHVAGVSSVDELWLTEGEYDAAAVDQLARPWNTEDFIIRSLTQTNGAGKFPDLVAAFAKLRISVGCFVLATDQDAAGEEAAWKAAQKLQSTHSVFRARWDEGLKDANAYLVAGGDYASIRLEKFTSPKIFV